MSAGANRAVHYFDSIAGEYANCAASAPSYAERFALYRRLITAHVGPALGTRAIDVGCGAGTLALYLARRGFETIAIDGSEGMLAAARNAAASQGITGLLEFRRARLPLDETTLGELRGTARVVVASSVIEFIEDDHEFLAQCSELLKPGGVALVSFANGAAIYRRLERRMRKTAWLRNSFMSVQRHQYTEATARRLAHDARLVTVEVHYYTLPAHRYLHTLVRRRPPWLATLFVLVLSRPAE